MYVPGTCVAQTYLARVKGKFGASLSHLTALEDNDLFAATESEEIKSGMLLSKSGSVDRQSLKKRSRAKMAGDGDFDAVSNSGQKSHKSNANDEKQYDNCIIGTDNERVGEFSSDNNINVYSISNCDDKGEGGTPGNSTSKRIGYGWRRIAHRENTKKDSMNINDSSTVNDNVIGGENANLSTASGTEQVELRTHELVVRCPLGVSSFKDGE